MFLKKCIYKHTNRACDDECHTDDESLQMEATTDDVYTSLSVHEMLKHLNKSEEEDVQVFVWFTEGCWTSADPYPLRLQPILDEGSAPKQDSVLLHLDDSRHHH